MPESIKSLNARIAALEQRNKKVEANKAWESSWLRKILIGIFTYISIGLYLRFVIDIDPIVNAIVPTAGFLLSTLTLPYFRELWKKYFYKK